MQLDMKLSFKKVNNSSINSQLKSSRRNQVLSRRAELKMLKLNPVSNCILCQRRVSQKKLIKLIHKALQRKYCGPYKTGFTLFLKNVIRAKKGTKAFLWYEENILYSSPDNRLLFYPVKQPLRQLKALLNNQLGEDQDEGMEEQLDPRGRVGGSCPQKKQSFSPFLKNSDLLSQNDQQCSANEHIKILDGLKKQLDIYPNKQQKENSETSRLEQDNRFNFIPKIVINDFQLQHLIYYLKQKDILDKKMNRLDRSEIAQFELCSSQRDFTRVLPLLNDKFEERRQSSINFLEGQSNQVSLTLQKRVQELSQIDRESRIQKYLGEEISPYSLGSSMSNPVDPSFSYFSILHELSPQLRHRGKEQSDDTKETNNANQSAAIINQKYYFLKKGGPYKREKLPQIEDSDRTKEGFQNGGGSNDDLGSQDFVDPFNLSKGDNYHIDIVEYHDIEDQKSNGDVDDKNLLEKILSKHKDTILRKELRQKEVDIHKFPNISDFEVVFKTCQENDQNNSPTNGKIVANKNHVDPATPNPTPKNLLNIHLKSTKLFSKNELSPKNSIRDSSPRLIDIKKTTEKLKQFIPSSPNNIQSTVECRLSQKYMRGINNLIKQSSKKKMTKYIQNNSSNRSPNYGPSSHQISRKISHRSIKNVRHPPLKERRTSPNRIPLSNSVNTTLKQFLMRPSSHLNFERRKNSIVEYDSSEKKGNKHANNMMESSKRMVSIRELIDFKIKRSDKDGFPPYKQNFLDHRKSMVLSKSRGSRDRNQNPELRQSTPLKQNAFFKQPGSEISRTKIKEIKVQELQSCTPHQSPQSLKKSKSIQNRMRLFKSRRSFLKFTTDKSKNKQSISRSQSKNSGLKASPENRLSHRNTQYYTSITHNQQFYRRSSNRRLSPNYYQLEIRQSSQIKNTINKDKRVTAKDNLLSNQSKIRNQILGNGNLGREHLSGQDMEKDGRRNLKSPKNQLPFQRKNVFSPFRELNRLKRDNNIKESLVNSPRNKLRAKICQRRELRRNKNKFQASLSPPSHN